MDDVRQDLASGSRLTRVLRSTWTVDALVSLALAGWYYRYGLGHFRDRLYDTFDQKLMIYLLEWLRHSLLEGSVAGVFHPNVLYPNRNVLAWSDTLLGFLPVYVPLRAVTSNPILALNCTAFVAVFAGNFGVMRLGREVTGRTSFIAAAVGGVGLLAAAMESHFQLKSLCLVVWALCFAARFVRGEGRALPWLIALSAWLFLCSVYYAVMLAVLVASALLLALVLGRGRLVRWLRGTLSGIRPAPACAIVAGSLVPALWVARHYLEVKSRFGGYPLKEMVTYSARLASLADPPQWSLVYKTLYWHWGSHESRLSFGLLVWFAVALLALGWRRWPAAEANRRVVALAAFGALLCTVLALGPYERHSLGHGIHVPLPAYAYAKLFPGFSALRTVGRFGVIAAVFMGLLAEVGTRNVLDLLGRSPGRTRAAYALVGALFLLEQTTVRRPNHLELVPRRPVYEAIGAHTNADAVVLELPVTVPGHIENLSWWLDQMLGSTLHWRRIPVGYTGLEAESVRPLVDSYRELEGGAPTRFFEEIRRAGVTHVVVDADLLPPELDGRVRRELAARGFEEQRLVGRASIFTSASPEGSRASGR